MKKLYLIIILSTFVVFIISGCGKHLFSGSITGNNEQFIIDYLVMNSTKTHEMKLEKGINIDTIIENKSGHLDILITNSNGEEIYRGDDVKSSKFSIEIPKTDTYNFSVTGNKAKGIISFKVAK